MSYLTTKVGAVVSGSGDSVFVFVVDVGERKKRMEM